jgi:hypothetical protein
MHPRLDRGGAQAQDARDFPVRQALNVPQKDARSIVARELRQASLERRGAFEQADLPHDGHQHILSNLFCISRVGKDSILRMASAA